MKQLIYILLLFLVPLSAQSQVSFDVCGTKTTKADMQRLIANKLAASKINYHKSGAITWVPMKFHLVADNNGSGRIDQSRVFDVICNLNADYLDQDIQFYISGDFNLINNTVIYNHTTSGAGTQMQIRKANNALNVFIGNSAGASSGGGVTLGYYSGFRDLIFAVKSTMTATNNTLTHEVGHFFSIPHVFYGWEETDYEDNYYNNDNTSLPNPPNTLNYAGQTIHVEKADGSNCATAADLFCDTPADYNLGLGWPQGNCNYNNGAVDPTGAAIDPDESNYMCYFNAINCINSFTAEQKAAIAADLASGSRTFLRQNPPTATTEVTAMTTLVEPINNQPAIYYDNVLLKWTAVPNATHYFVQVSRFSSFAVLQDEFITTSTQATLTNLLSAKKYYWRVKAYNEISPCTNMTAHEDFTTSNITVKTKNIQGLNNISLRPNVISNNQTANLVIDTEKNFETTIRIFGMNGQVMNEENVNIQSGLTNHQLNTQNLSAGLYIVSLEIEGKRVNRKLVISN